MKAKYSFFFKVTILSTLLVGLIFQTSNAQNIYKRNRSPNETCRKLTQSLWMGKTTSGQKKEEWLIYEVGRLQKLLDKLGYFGPKPDWGENYDIGYFDKATYNAVKKYQIENTPWIKATGMVGPQTLDFINRYEFCNSDRRFAQLKMDKTFTMTGEGFSFKYPSVDFIYSPLVIDKDVSKLKTYLDVCNIDEYTPVEIQKRTLCYKTSRSGSFVGASLVSNVLKDLKTEEACMKADPKAKKQEEDFEPIVKMNGFSFLFYQMVKKEVGHEFDTDVYRIFKNKKCYEFRLNRELSRIGTFTTAEEGLDEVTDLAVGRMRASLETIEFTK